MQCARDNLAVSWRDNLAVSWRWWFAGTESEVQALLDVLPEAVRDSIVQLVKDKQSTGHEAAVQEAHSTKK